MPEEIKDTKITESTETTEESTAENAGKKTTEDPKKFTQADLDRVVRERLAREKDTNKKLIDDATSERDALQDVVTSYEGIIKKIIDAKKGDVIPDNFMPLFEKMTLIEQFDFLNDDKNKLASKKPIPSTPVANGEQKDKPQYKKAANYF